ncbi:hypothetical protein WDW37_20240 [Bdellovibrionota bacterium FG-1]
MQKIAWVLFCGLLLTPEALSWDGHAPLTHQTLLGFKYRSAPLWNELHRPIQVTPLENFLSAAFGPHCLPPQAKHGVFGGLGKDFNTLYTPGITYTMNVDWDKGISKVTIHTMAEGNAPSNPQGLGHSVLPLDVISIYSDEPDWNMDDDVPELRGKGVAQASEGTSTRLLRHFWYKDEEEVGVHFDKDQETDQRFQLYYQLSLMAFSVGHPYWGYRFLGNSLHYLQDMTQPFHTKAIINDRMIDKIGIIQAFLCDARHRKDCQPETQTVDGAVIKNGWVVGAYHSAYEDFGHGLVNSSNRFQSVLWIQDPDLANESEIGLEEISWPDSAHNPGLTVTQVIHSAQRVVNGFSDNTGNLSYKAFGWQYRYDQEIAKKQVLMTGSTLSLPYQIASLFGFFDFNLDSVQTQAVQPLVTQTHQLYARLGIWGRHWVEKVMLDSNRSEILQGLLPLKKILTNQCVNMSQKKLR